MRKSSFIYGLSMLSAALCLAPGCRTAGGRAESLHQVEKYNDAGKIVSREISRDTSYMGVKGLFASDSASTLKHGRTNFLGSAAETSVGKFSGQPEAASITAAGGAVGTAAGAILGNVVPVMNSSTNR